MAAAQADVRAREAEMRAAAVEQQSNYFVVRLFVICDECVLIKGSSYFMVLACSALSCQPVLAVATGNNPVCFCSLTSQIEALLGWKHGRPGSRLSNNQ